MIKTTKHDLDSIREFHKHIMQFDNDATQAIDLAHNFLLFGTVLSAKPKNVLELGIGTGYVSKAILFGLKYNGIGNLTCVDSIKDWASEPPHFEEIRNMGANIILATEKDFTINQAENSFDLLVSDADHKNAFQWLDKTLDMMSAESVMFFHDTNHLPGLLGVQAALKEKGITNFHFTKNSRTDERCGRGWLMAFKN